MKGLKWLATASALALAVCAAPAFADVSIEDIVNDAKTTNDVVTSGLGGQGQRYSPLKSVLKKTLAHWFLLGRCRSAAKKCAARNHSRSSKTA